jgi:hypothetical protein
MSLVVGFDPKTSGSAVVLTIDCYSNFLRASGLTILSATKSIVEVYKGTDASPSGLFSGEPQINSVVEIVNGVSCPAGTVLKQLVHGGEDGAGYLMQWALALSDTIQTEEIQATIEVLDSFI